MGSQAVSYDYDTNYWLTGVDTPALDLDFVRDEIGNLTELTTGSSSDQRVFTLDALSRITDVDDGALSPVEAFTYDDTGNRLTKTVGAGSPVSYGYGSGTHRLTTLGAASRTYDAAGSMSSDGTLTFTHDDRQRLVQVANGLGPVLQAGYNAQGQRVKKIGSGGTEWFVFGQGGEILGHYDSAGDLIQEFIWMGGWPVGVKQGTGSGQAYAGELLPVHSDQLGSPRAVVRPGGSPTHETVWSWDWKAGVFGDGAADVDPDADTVGLEMGLRFPGQWMDTETGLHYNYFRDYEPGVGRYGQSDPIGLNGGPSTYSYVGANPSAKSDPSGLWVPGTHAAMTRVAAGRCGCSKIGAKLGDLVAAVDDLEGSQNPDNSHWHAMSNGVNNQSTSEARKEFEKHVDDEMAKSCDLEALAMAIHATQDSFSPAHEGFKPWNGMPPWWKMPLLAGHGLIDFFPDPYDYENSVWATQILITKAKRACPCLCE